MKWKDVTNSFSEEQRYNIKDEQRIQKDLNMLLDLAYWYEDEIEVIYYNL